MQIGTFPLDNSKQNHSFFRYSSLKHALVTAVALTCLFIGIVSLISLFPTGISLGLGSISHLEIYFCIPSLILGLLALNYSVISICYRKNLIIKNHPARESSEPNFEDSEGTQNIQIISQSRLKNSPTIKQSTGEEKISSDVFLKKMEEDYEKGNLVQTHYNIYSRLDSEDKCLIPLLSSFPNEFSSSLFGYYKLLFQLIYMSDEGILSLPLYVVKIICQNHLGKQILSKRLLIIEKYEKISRFKLKKQIGFNESSLACSSFDKTSLLSFFRDIQITDIQINDQITPLLCFLNSSNLISFLKHRKLSQKLLSICFPLDQIEYTSFKLRKLTIRTILKYKNLWPVNFLLFFKPIDHPYFPWNSFIKQKNVGQFLHLRPEINYEPNFPWHKLAKNPSEIVALFNIDSDVEIKLTQMILEKLHVTAIKSIAKCLSAKHLLLFSQKQLALKKFPWSIFFTKKAIGSKLRLLSKEVIKLEHINWKKLKDPTEIAILFDLSCDSNRTVTKTILQNMHLFGICTFAKQLSLEHFYLFSTKQLLHADFPWIDFVHYKGISKALKTRPVDVFACDYFPWIFFVTENLEEFKTLFNLKNGSNAYIVKSIINNLKMPAIISIAHALPSKFILFFSEEQLLEKGFPWETFFAKKNIGKYLRKFRLSFFTSKEIPWEKLKQNSFALSQFFSTEKSEIELTKKIFQLVNNEEKKLDLISEEDLSM